LIEQAEDFAHDQMTDGAASKRSPSSTAARAECPSAIDCRRQRSQR